MRLIILLALAGARLMAAEFSVHEWGTFTSVVGSDGVQLTGLEAEEHALPPFVESFSGIAPANKGFDRPLRGVTVKMETPVIYFYAKEPLSVHVSVLFHGGSISQWYPSRVSGENVPEPAFGSVIAPVLDFSKGHEGSAAWDVAVLSPSSTEKINALHVYETPQWPRARVAEANLVRGPKGEVENFIFYRGVARFGLPLEITSGKGGTLHLKNRGAQPLPFLWIYRKETATTAPLSWVGSLGAGETKTPERLVQQEVKFAEALTAAGLTAEEAKALMATWRESYFDAPGLRVFWIVPRAFTDSILPLSISPQPSQIVRVMVGRTEVLTPEFESTLLKDFSGNKIERWQKNRYFVAYKERVQQLKQIAQATNRF